MPEEIQYLHVRFDVSSTDWTWEREWRFKQDELILDPTKVTLIVPNRRIIETLKEEVNSSNFVLNLIDAPLTEKLEWHFISLEDLG